MGKKSIFVFVNEIYHAILRDAYYEIKFQNVRICCALC
jgi:hypothetical protein